MRIYEIINEITDFKDRGQFINKNVEGENIFSLDPADRAALNGKTVYHQTREKRLPNIIKTNGLRPRQDETGAREFGLPSVRAGRDFYIPKGIFVSPGSNGWVGGVEFSWKILPSDKIVRAYSSTGHLLFLNPITLDRMTVTDIKGNPINLNDFIKKPAPIAQQDRASDS